ncbi:hypothetical protein RLIN73S_07435 [Rhodanobacter lindaniclasticus]
MASATSIRTRPTMRPPTVRGAASPPTVVSVAVAHQMPEKRPRPLSDGSGRRRYSSSQSRLPATSSNSTSAVATVRNTGDSSARATASQPAACPPRTATPSPVLRMGWLKSVCCAPAAVAVIAPRPTSTLLSRTASSRPSRAYGW